MDHKRKLLHRLSYFNQVRERRVRMDAKSDYLLFSDAVNKAQTENPQRAKEKTKPKLSLFSKIFAYFAKKKTAPLVTPKVPVPSMELRRYVTKLKAVDSTDKQLKTFIGPDILAKDQQEAERLLKHSGQDYLQVIGELAISYDYFGSDVTWQDRMN